MADLEHLLLEAAGRTSTPERKTHSFPPRRLHDHNYNVNGSDSGEEDDSDDNEGFSSRKQPATGSRPKKRHGVGVHGRKYEDPDSPDDDDDEPRMEGEGVSDESDVGADLYKNDDDRHNLSLMSELQRELILTERAEKKGDKSLTEKLRSKREIERPPRSRKLSSPPSSAHGTRSRSSEKAGVKDEALNELRARHLGQQDVDAHDKFGGTQNLAPENATSSESDSESESRGEGRAAMGIGGMPESDDEGDPLSGRPTYDEIKEITIRRSKLAKWLMEPWFDDLITGCFVRVGIGKSRSGPVYRLCLVRNVDASHPDRAYRLENKTTCKYLNVTWGSEHSAARWQMIMVSDSVPTEQEYRQWVREVDRNMGWMPTRREVMDKKEAIQKSSTYVYSPSTVKQMLQEKKSASSRPLNIAAEKERLRRELEIAQSKEDNAAIDCIQAKIQELEATRRAQVKDAKAVKLEEMNRRNRAENFRKASESQAVNSSMTPGSATYDPFSRRWTRSKNYYSTKASEAGSSIAKGNEAASVVLNVDGFGASATEVVAAGMAATKAALEAAAGAGKLVDTAAPVDKSTKLNPLHDFEIPISLTVLQMFGGPQGAQAGFMARKQKIEATVGCRVPEYDGKDHPHTLSISDYKRRRGII